MADLFDIVVARKLSGGGGGGSSDFSTAEVTIVNNTGSYYVLQGAFFREEEQGIGETIPASTRYSADIDENTTTTVTVILYKGSAIIYSADWLGVTLIITGQASEESYGILVSGDCTITIS